MRLRVVVDTDIWIRALLDGQVSLPDLMALRAGKYQVVISDALMDELREVLQRPRLRSRIDPFDANELLELLEWYGEAVELRSVPPRCRDPKDYPVLTTAMDGKADAIVTGDDDLRADDELRIAMADYGTQLWGVQSLLAALEND
jgi:putative PIN family toxin of toxin-antitoxin system